MAVTNESSTEFTNQNATPPTIMDSIDNGGRVRFAKVTFTQGAAAGDANSTIDLIELPAGKVRFLGNMSSLVFSAFGAARVLDIGWLAYTDQNGTAVVADADGLDDGIDVSAAGRVTLGTNTAVTSGDSLVFQSRGPVTLQATVLGGTIPAAATVEGVIAYTFD
jgi:hypothetical protein